MDSGRSRVSREKREKQIIVMMYEKAVIFVQKWDDWALPASYVPKIKSSFCMMESVDGKLQKNFKFPG